jgi:hypothetical protein
MCPVDSILCYLTDVLTVTTTSQSVHKQMRRIAACELLYPILTESTHLSLVAHFILSQMCTFDNTDMIPHAVSTDIPLWYDECVRETQEHEGQCEHG